MFLCAGPLLVLFLRPPAGFVWPSAGLQQDLMTFIIRWGNLIWAAPLSEMSRPIRSHAGENKESNYSLGVGAVCGWREHGGSGLREKSGRRRAWLIRGINSELPPSGYEIWVGICFLIVSGAAAGVTLHELSKQRRLFMGTWGPGQISDVWLGRNLAAEVLPSKSNQHIFTQGPKQKVWFQFHLQLWLYVTKRRLAQGSFTVAPTLMKTRWQ